MIQLILSSKVRFGLLWELLDSNETLEHRARGTFAALSVKEWNGMATETNTLPILNIDFAIETKHKRNKLNIQ